MLADIEMLLSRAQRETLAMLVAFQRNPEDPIVGHSYVRANRALDAVALVIEVMTEHEPGTEAVLKSLSTIRVWARHRIAMSSSASPRLAEVAHDPGSVTFDGDDVAFRGLDLSGVDLRDSSFRRSRWEQCRLDEGSLSASIFDDAYATECKIDRANWERASLRRMRVDQTRMPGAALNDTILDGATFTDCILRGADFSAPTSGEFATARGATFVRCDLRETNWRGRVLCGVRFVGCKLHGVFGRPRLEDVEIEAADLSVAGSEVPASAAQVIAGWRE